VVSWVKVASFIYITEDSRPRHIRRQNLHISTLINRATILKMFDISAYLEEIDADDPWNTREIRERGILPKDYLSV
jgi:hypothetical protein